MLLNVNQDEQNIDSSVESELLQITLERDSLKLFFENLKEEINNENLIDASYSISEFIKFLS